MPIQAPAVGLFLDKFVGAAVEEAEIPSPAVGADTVSDGPVCNRVEGVEGRVEASVWTVKLGASLVDVEAGGMTRLDDGTEEAA